MLESILYIISSTSFSKVFHTTSLILLHMTELKILYSQVCDINTSQTYGCNFHEFLKRQNNLSKSPLFPPAYQACWQKAGSWGLLAQQIKHRAWNQIIEESGQKCPNEIKLKCLCLLCFCSMQKQRHPVKMKILRSGNGHSLETNPRRLCSR